MIVNEFHMPFPCFNFKKKKKNILQLGCPKGISPMGVSGGLPREKPAATESRYSTCGAGWVF